MQSGRRETRALVPAVSTREKTMFKIIVSQLLTKTLQLQPQNALRVQDDWFVECAAEVNITQGERGQQKQQQTKAKVSNTGAREKDRELIELWNTKYLKKLEEEQTKDKKP